MKKVLLSTMVGGLLLTSANANIIDRGHFGISLGSVKFENADAGASIGFISKFEKNVFGDFYVGLGTNLEIFDAKDIVPDEDLGLIADIYPIITYDITKDLSVNASYAYTTGYIGNSSNNFDGTTAGFGIAYKFSNGFEIEAKYKHSQLEWTNDIKFDTDRINLAFNFRFGK